MKFLSKIVLASSIFMAQVSTYIAQAEARFSRSEINHVVKDRMTSLEWLEGPSKRTSWKQAQEWIKSLGEDWRAPSVEELKTLYLKNSKREGIYGDPLRIDESFKMEKAYTLWAEKSEDGYASLFDFSRGVPKWTGQNVAGYYDRAIAVRGKDITVVIPGDGRFIRNEENGIITDKLTKLQWLEGPEKATSWEEADAWLKTLGGKWRVPTIEELSKLYLKDSKRKGIYQDPLCIHRSFKMKGAYSLWSVQRTSNSAWMFDFSRGYAHWTETSVSGTFDRAIAVRVSPEEEKKERFNKLYDIK